MYRIGIVAPPWSLEHILSAFRKFDSFITPEPLLCEELGAIPALLENRKERLDGWFLSGPLIYLVARHHLKSDRDLFFCRITEADFYRAVLRILRDCGGRFPCSSADFIEGWADIGEMLEQVGISFRMVSLKTYAYPMDEAAFLDFHRSLLEARKVRCAITTIPSVYRDLKKMGWPVYGLYVTPMEIALSVELLAEQLRSRSFKNSQLGLQRIEICRYDRIAERAVTPYRLQLLELQIKKVLLKYCQDINGYLVDKGYGRFEIFGTRGNFERDAESLGETLNRLSAELETEVVAGVGIGDTVFAAQLNAGHAIENARGRRNIVIVQGNGQIVEMLPGRPLMAYRDYSEDQGLIERLRQAKIGIKTYNRLRAVARQNGWEGFSAATLARELNMTDRNARRILSNLSKAELVERIGVETTEGSGRPGKLYRFIEKIPGPEA